MKRDRIRCVLKKGKGRVRTSKKQIFIGLEIEGGKTIIKPLWVVRKFEKFDCLLLCQFRNAFKCLE